MGFPFVKGFKVADGEGLHPRSPEALSVFGTGALLLCQPSEMVRVAGLAPASSSFRGRPSAADITPWRWRCRQDSHPHRFPAIHSAFRVLHSALKKLVSAAGVAPAIPRSQAERVGCYTTR